MSEQCKVHCHNCDNNYYVYDRGLTHNNIINCPHCDAKMDQTMWDMVVGAILAVKEANYHFLKYHNERNEDLFDISVESVYVPLNKFR